MLESLPGGRKRPTRRRNGEATRTKLLRTALELFSAHSIDDVTVRDITNQAQTSSGAVNYYFGSKAGLIEELLRRQAADVNERRELVLEKLEALDAVSIRDVAEVFVIPSRGADEELGAPGTSAAFLSAVAAHPDYADLLSSLYEPSNARLLALLVTATPHLSDDIRMVRWAMAKHLVNHAVANPSSSFNTLLNYRRIDRSAWISDALVDALAALFEAPSTVAPPTV